MSPEVSHQLQLVVISRQTFRKLLYVSDSYSPLSLLIMQLEAILDMQGAVMTLSICMHRNPIASYKKPPVVLNESGTLTWLQRLFSHSLPMAAMMRLLEQQQAPCGSPFPLRQGFRGYLQFHYRVDVMSLWAQHSDRAAEATFT